jgi:hypothetical protein
MDNSKYILTLRTGEQSADRIHGLTAAQVEAPGRAIAGFMANERFSLDDDGTIVRNFDWA